MNIPRDFIDLLLARVDLVDLIHTQVPLQKKSGSNYFARCPFHDEKSASFSVSATKQFYYCFGCGAHGNAIDFVMRQDRLPFPEAIEALARQVGLTVPQETGSVKKKPATASLYEFLSQSMEFYYQQMRTSQRAIQYLKQRGITGTIAKQFHLGYADNHWQMLLQNFGKTESDHKNLLQAGLIIKKTDGSFYDRFRDRIMFPIFDYRGRVVGFGGRIIDQGEPKYLNSPETSVFQKGHELYGLYQSLKANHKLEQIILVEGYMDVIALFQHGITCAAATLGTATTKYHIDRLSRYTANIIFAFDGDQAGLKAAERAMQVVLPLMDDHLQIKFLFLPKGEDPDSFIRKESKEAFLTQLQKATPLSAFFFETLNKVCDLTTMEGRARLASLSLESIDPLPQTLFKTLLLEELSRRSRISLSELKAKLTKTKLATKSKEKETDSLANFAPPMRLALSLLIKHPSLVHHVEKPLELTELAGADFFNQIIDILKARPHISTGSLFECFRGQTVGQLMVQLANSDQNIPHDGLEKEFIGALKQIELIGYEEEINRLLAKAAKEGLTQEEKLVLSAKINNKKLLINQYS